MTGPDINVHAKQIETLEKSDEKQWDEISGIKKHLQKLIPFWVAMVLMACSFVTGSALTFAGMIVKFSGK